ncbi:MAG: hypothetical protein WBO77_02555 [Microgenomates group bacterium]
MTIEVEDKKSGIVDELSKKATIWIGTPTSIMVHTFLFFGIFGLSIFGLTLNQILLILTTAVSLEAIYLAIFIQMTVNQHTESLENVEDDIEEIQEDIDELEQDVDDLEEDSDLIQKDVEELSGDIVPGGKMGTADALQHIQKNLQVLTKSLTEIQKDIDSLKAGK